MSDSNKDIALLKDQIKSLKRAVYHLVWKRSGFGDQCVHCAGQYPKHDPNCRLLDIDQLIR